ncbi:nuclear transport factor 2 family protein [Priestia abyssalis]|uniref:nuclear transport factor 2 family protein n=1 Tax=Priestia abyssalis TaxID=1221450 RepID=UPI000995D502|nr:nuclear transport factor 2 family protein [Priestia abyssalis]
MEHSSLEEHILHLEKQLMSYDYKELDEHLAYDFLEFGSSGNTYSKKAQLDAVRNIATTSSIRFTVTDFNIKLLAPDVLFATYRTFRQTIVNLHYEVPFGN